MNLKTKNQVIEENPEYKTLINAVIARAGMNSVEGVIEYGAAGGVRGFDMFNKTHKFATKHRKQIIQLLEDTAESLNEEVITMIKQFSIFTSYGMDKDDVKMLYRYLGDASVTPCRAVNALAWFALEEVCRWFDAE